MQQIDGTNTAMGNLDLKLEEFQQAEDKREQLLEKWDKSFMASSKRRKVYIM